MRYNKDPRLGDMADRLQRISFTSELLPESASREKLNELQESHVRGKHKGCAVLNNQHILVSIYAGGQTRTLATFRTNYLHACRVADMITLRFGPWRLQRPRTVEPDEYNFSEAQAKLDWQQEPKLTEVIIEMEGYLRSIGALLDPNKPTEPLIKPPKGGKQLMRTLEARLATIEEKLDQLLKQR